MSNREQFASWLSSKVSSSCLGDCFLALAKVEEYAKKKRFIQGSIYDVTDPSVSAKIVNGINSDHIFRYFHKKQMRSIVEFAQLFHKYVKERNEKPVQVSAPQSIQSKLPMKKPFPTLVAAEPAFQSRKISGSAPKPPHKQETEPKQKSVPNLEAKQAAESLDALLFASKPVKLEPLEPSKPETSKPMITGTPEASETTLDLRDKTDLSFTKPTSVSYFGERKSVTSWRILYVTVCEHLFDDYPGVFEELRKSAISGTQRALIFDKEGSKRLTTPICIAEGYYVETNRSANDLMHRLKVLLDICRVDYENVEIRYKNNTEQQQTKIVSEKTDGTITVAHDDPVISYLKHEGMRYIDHRDKSGCLWILGGMEIAAQLKLLQAGGVKIYFKAGGGSATDGRDAWWTKDRPKSLKITEETTKQPENMRVAAPTDGCTSFEDWLVEKVPKAGARRTMVWAVGRIGEYANKYNFLSGSIFHVVDVDRLSQIWEQLCTIDEFVTFRDWSEQFPKAFSLYLKFRGDETQDHTTVTGNGYDSIIPSSTTEQSIPIQEPEENRTSTYVKQLEEIVLAADMQGISYDEAKNAINTTMVATKQAVAESKHIIDVRGRLIHEDAFVDWTEGADQLEAIIDKLMQKNNGYISAAQLYQYAKVEMNMFLTDNDVNDERAIYDIASYLFEKKHYHSKKYIFFGKLHISRPDHPVTSNLDIFRNYANDQGGVFSFNSLVEYLQSIGVNTGNLRAQMRIPDEPLFFYYESGLLMCADSMHIDVAWKAAVKQELAALLSDVGNHIILRSIPQNWLERLPALPGRRPWTPLLVQSVLRCYSNELGAKTIQALSGQSFDTIHAMLVANDSPIQSFGDAVISYLMDNKIEKRSFEAEELRLLLADGEMIQGNELIWNMSKALQNDERFAWNASGDHVTVEI